MKIAVASDHRGVDRKSRILELLRGLGHEALDRGADGEESVDYPDFAAVVASQVAAGDVDLGILICGTGIGMSIAANKFDGIRAANVRDDLEARMSRQHNDSNVLCLSADLVGDQSLERIIEIWLKTEFEGGRHARRIDKITEFEQAQTPAPTADAAD